MKTLDKGKDKIKDICKVLKDETLEPAKQEAAQIIEDAKAEAARIVKEAEAQADEIVAQAKERMKKEQAVFHSALEQAGKQSLEALRQDVEGKFFSEELSSLVSSASSDPKLVAKLIEAIVKAVEKDGVTADLEALVPASVSAKAVNEALSESILKRLNGGTVEVGSFQGGAKVKMVGQRMTIDISDSALKELLSSYVRKDFRKLLFG